MKNNKELYAQLFLFLKGVIRGSYVVESEIFSISYVKVYDDFCFVEVLYSLAESIRLVILIFVISGPVNISLEDLSIFIVLIHKDWLFEFQLDISFIVVIRCNKDFWISISPFFSYEYNKLIDGEISRAFFVKLDFYEPVTNILYSEGLHGDFHFLPIELHKWKEGRFVFCQV